MRWPNVFSGSVSKHPRKDTYNGGINLPCTSVVTSGLRHHNTVILGFVSSTRYRNTQGLFSWDVRNGNGQKAVLYILEKGM